MKLSEQGQTTIAGVFQRALALLEDVSYILEDLEWKVDEFGELECTNPELCAISQEELDSALNEFQEELEK